MRLNIFYFIFILILSVGFLSCKKSIIDFKEAKSCERNIITPSFYFDNDINISRTSSDLKICGLLPLSKTAKWIYKDSIFENGSFSLIKMDTLFVEQIIKSSSDNTIWWNLKSDRFKGIPSKIYTTDSILFMMDISTNQNKSVFKSYEWLQLIPQDSVRKPNNFSDIFYLEMNKKLKSTIIKVPSGSFNNCIQNIKYLGTTNHEIIFKPEYGVIKFTSYKVVGNPFNLNPANKLQVSELVEIVR